MQLKINKLDRAAYNELCKVVEQRDITYAVGSDSPNCVDITIDMCNIYGIRAVGCFCTVILENYNTYNKVVLSDRMFGSVTVI